MLHQGVNTCIQSLDVEAYIHMYTLFANFGSQCRGRSCRITECTINAAIRCNVPLIRFNTRQINQQIAFQKDSLPRLYLKSRLKAPAAPGLLVDWLGAALGARW